MASRSQPTELVAAFQSDAAALPKLAKALTQDAFVKKARERVWAMLHARKIGSIQLSRLDGGSGVEDLNRIFGEGNWVEHRGRVIYRIDDADAQMAAAREILSRAEPQLNRMDPGSTRTFKVFRLDPNQGDAVGVREIASAEVPQIAETTEEKLFKDAYAGEVEDVEAG